MTPPVAQTNRPSTRPGGPESLVGSVLGGRYRVERLIGEGGMGAVYQAEHTHMHKRLAVKVLHPEMGRLPEAVARFEREAMAAAHIDHPNVAAATDFGKLDDGSFFLVLEYVEGRSLRAALGKGRLELGRALHIVRQIASALARAHSLGIVHRDLKPENIMLVERDGDRDFVKVLDFGIAKVPIGDLLGEQHAGQALTQVGMVYGTPEYMAPEQALGQSVDARADLYALGAMAFEMVTGTRPYQHESKVTLLGMHVTAPIPRMAERAPDANIPVGIDDIVTRLLAKDAAARFADAKELIDALDATSAQLLTTGRIVDPAGPTSVQQSLAAAPRPAPTARASRWPRAAGVVIAVTAVGGLLAHFVVAGRTVSGTSASAGSAASVAAAPPRVPDGKADTAVVASAQANIDRGDFATAIAALSEVEKKSPNRGDVHVLLERAYAALHETRDAVREAGLALAADARIAADLKLQEDVRNAALPKADAQDEAFALLEAKMGPRGLDILYDIAYGASGRLYPQAAARAKHSLELPDVKGRASAALSVLLDFRDAKTCEERRGLLDRARDHGDARLTLVLQPYESTHGCGFLGRSDCYPCMHKDRQLAEAMGAIMDRYGH